MLFNSIEFLFFFPIVTALYFTFPYKFRWILLLISSCIFYMAFIPVYILILFITILIDYYAGLRIELSTGNKKKAYLILSIISTCLVLFIFKYFNFFNSNIITLSELLHWNYSITNLEIILPIGLSFHTFQSLSYVIEVYKGNQKAEKHFGIYSLYVMFYPQLVAGPIERPQNLLHQFHTEHKFSYQNMTDGLKRMVWGMFKKVVIADRLASFVNPVYDSPTQYPSISLIIATIFFAFQIYCDFSGYSDIAIGAAQTMGFKLMTNFSRPYHAKSVSEFWKRWHISLSTWFKDYLYIPLGGNRVTKLRMYFNLFFTFLISGLWHGASWTFVVWGALNGIYIILGSLTFNIRKKFIDLIHLDKFSLLHNSIRVLITFILICFSWIFFRANNISDALYIISHLFDGIGYTLYILHDRDFIKKYILLRHNLSEFSIAIISIAIMELVHVYQRKHSIKNWLAKNHVIYRWIIYYIAVMSIIVFGFFSKEQFIYFQF